MTTTYPASTKQIAFATKLINERVTETVIEDLDGIPGREISRMIDGLLHAPRRTNTPMAKPGFYVNDGIVLRVHAGVQIKVRPHTQLSFGYSLYHFSNGDIGVRNPALDSNFIYSTLNFDFHRRTKWLP